MARSKDPFANVKLSEQVGLDQRLFSEEKPPSPPHGGTPATPPESPTQETRKQVSQEGSLPARKVASQERGKDASQQADQGEGSLAEVPVLKNSFLFTEEEWNLFDDLKIALRRTYGIKATKNDLARAAIRFLTEDYQKRKEASFLVKKLSRK